MKKIKVFIVDDSALVRQTLTNILTTDSEIQVIGAAPDPIFAMHKMKKNSPDVIILDIEMPRMDGLTFLKKIMLENPTPVIICSTLTEKGAKITLDALAFGALAIINKPKIGLKDFFDESKEILLNSVKTAGRANIQQVKRISDQHLKMKEIPVRGKKSYHQIKIQPKLSADAILSLDSYNIEKTTDKVVAIGTSAGGTIALEVVLKELPRVCPGMLIVQHMPEKFTTTFAERLNQICEIQVKEAENGDRVIPGLALIAPGNKHILLKKSGAQYYANIVEGPLVSRHRPSVDVLFRSVAKSAGKNALGIIMTGMGDDGATGILEMFKSGAKTVAQSEKTCVVFGMPNEAIKLGGIKKVVDLEKIAGNILQYYQKDQI